jgi:hypothetical protein
MADEKGYPAGSDGDRLRQLEKENNRSADLGYQAIGHEGIVYELAKPTDVTYHAYGFNHSHIGIAFKHEGLRVREVEGCVPAQNRRTGQKGMFQKRYDPRDLHAMALHAADLLREHCGGGGGQILFHDESDKMKNDPGPASPREKWKQGVYALVEDPSIPFDFSQFAPEGFDY